MNVFNTFILSRTDNIGDVVLTLPMAGVLKQHYPGCKIYFIGKIYTQAIIQNCEHVDVFLDKEEILQGNFDLKSCHADAIIYVFPDIKIATLGAKANIPLRIGTSHRWYHWLYCNRLVNLYRKSSSLHEAQLNIKLLGIMGIKKLYTLSEINSFYGYSNVPSDNNNEKPTIIIHPKSKGSAREWKLINYQNLILSLPKNKYTILITGSQDEGNKIRKELPDFFEITTATDLTGKLSVAELIQLIAKSSALLACSTGPLHIAAALGIHAIGLFPPICPINPSRWAPIGVNTKVFCINKDCSMCENNTICACINQISVGEIADYITQTL